MKQDTQPKFLRLPEVLLRVGFSKPQLYKLIADDQFPRQIKICKRTSVWLESDVNEWMLEQVKRSEEESALSDAALCATRATQWLREAS